MSACKGCVQWFCTGMFGMFFSPFTVLPDGGGLSSGTTDDRMVVMWQLRLLDDKRGRHDDRAGSLGERS